MSIDHVQSQVKFIFYLYNINNLIILELVNNGVPNSVDRMQPFFIFTLNCFYPWLGIHDSYSLQFIFIVCACIYLCVSDLWILFSFKCLIIHIKGCCCIDEFDKLTCDPAVLLEAMEQQSVSVARGGLVANLPARAAVLAAANPINGHYDITRRLDENLRIPPALLSR